MNFRSFTHRLGRSPQQQASDSGNGSGAGTGSGSGTTPPQGLLSTMTTRMLAGGASATTSTDKLNGQIVQAVQLTNAETSAYAPSQIAIGPDMMISQAAGLVAQSAANYFDGVSKLVLASQGVLLKELTQNLVAQNIEGAAEDALGIVATDVLLGMAAAVAAAAGAMEAESASFAIEKIDQSIATYSSLLKAQPPAPNAGSSSGADNAAAPGASTNTKTNTDAPTQPSDPSNT